MRLPQGPNLTPKHIWNPLATDFTTTYANENNEPISYTCPSLRISTFPTYIADHMAKHLAQEIVGHRGIKKDYQGDYEAALKEIMVEI